MNTAGGFIARKLAEREVAGNYRTLKPERDLIDFCSNDYLGFARSAALKNLVEAELRRHPQALNGSTGSRLLAGTHLHRNLEKEIAAYHKAEAGLIFNSGYDANVGLFSSLPQRGDTIITDELIHASIIDGLRLSHANRFTFKHNDAVSLEEKLKHATGICYIAIESVYSMDGDSPPFQDIITLAKQYNANIIVDEAHAVGFYGNGLINQLNLQDKIFARVVTFGKALGSHGAIVLGSNALRNYLINFARSFIYTTAAPFHSLAAIKSAYGLLPCAQAEIDTLQNNIIQFKRGIALHENLARSDSTIQSVLIKNNELTIAVSKALQDEGMDVRPILSPTVAAGAERLRICLHSFNTFEEINLLTSTINTLINA